MSFQKKSTWIMLVIVTAVYGAYFYVVFSEAVDADVASIQYKGLMLATVVVLVILAATAHIIVAVANPHEADQGDERDREINRFGEYIGGYALGVGALVSLGLAMTEVEYFWISNAILLGLVVSEIVSGGTKIVLYRRGV